MKKLLFLLAMFSGGILSAQVLPDNWTGDNQIATYQETADPKHGSSACQVDVLGTNPSQCDLGNTVTIPVTGGASYKFKFWYKSSANVKIKGHLLWDDGSDAWAIGNVGETDWKSKAKIDVVPAGATSVTIEFRFVTQAGWTDTETEYVDYITFESPQGTSLDVANGDFEDWPPTGVEDPANFIATAVSTSAIDLTWEQNANGDNVMLAWSTDGVFGVPEDGTTYNDGDAIPGGGTVLYTGSDLLFNHTGLTPGTQYYYEAWSVDGSVVYSTGVTDDTRTLKLEPSNHPISFSANAHILVIKTSWIEDTIGPNFPDAYLITGAMQGYTAETPVDGTPVDDDLDWSDGVVAFNMEEVENGFSNNFDFSNLDPETEYTFTIYAYANSGDNIDYKTDGTPLSATVTTANVTMISSEDFESGTSGSWTAYNVYGDKEWIFPTFRGKTTAKMYGVAGGEFQANEDWLISPELDLTGYNNVNFAFMNIRNNDGELLKLYASTDYDGSSDPNSFEWDDLTDMATWSSGNYELAFTEDMDLSDYLGQSVYLAFKYVSTDVAAVLYKLDNMQIYSYNPVINITDPNGGETLMQGVPYEITWDYTYGEEEEVAVYLSQGEGNDLLLITTSTDLNEGSYTWYVWSSAEPGDDYKIYLETPEGINDYSDDYFTIVEAGEIIPDFEASDTLIYVGDSVMFTDMTIGDPTSWLWTFEGGTPDTYDGQQPPYIHYNTAGVYDVTLEVSDGNSTETLTMNDYITVEEFPELPPPVELDGTVVNNYLDVLLSWYAPEQRDFELLGYNVYRDSEMLNTELVTDTSYLDVEPPLGSHEYYVTAVYDIGESDPSNVVVIVVTDVEENGLETIEVYPNPSSGKFTVSLPAGVNVEMNVMDMTGKTVYRTSVGKTTTIDLSKVHKGIYLLKMYDASTGRSVIRKLIMN